jgi:hypothetical protein
MWISKSEYEELKRKATVATDTKVEAAAFRSILKAIKEKTTIILDDFIIVTRDAWKEISDKYILTDDKVKDMEAELAWYKTKYHEMKTNESE